MGKGARKEKFQKIFPISLGEIMGSVNEEGICQPNCYHLQYCREERMGIENAQNVFNRTTCQPVALFAELLTHGNILRFYHAGHLWRVSVLVIIIVIINHQMS